LIIPTQEYQGLFMLFTKNFLAQGPLVIP
jgi:hypothetical protein